MSRILVAIHSDGNNLVNKVLRQAINDYKNKASESLSLKVTALYFFDPPLKPKNPKVLGGFSFLNEDLNEWLGLSQNFTKCYKLYSAYPNRQEFKTEIESIKKNKVSYVEVKNDLKKFNYSEKKKGKNSSLNEINNKYESLVDPYEIFSQDNKKYVFLFSLRNFKEYMPPYLVNYKGLNLGYGHSWFHNCFLTHALSNSKFT